MLAVFPTDEQRGLFIQTTENIIIHWGEAPGSETAKKPTAKEKWEMLKKWATTASVRLLPEGDYWAFSRGELQPVKTHPPQKRNPDGRN